MSEDFLARWSRLKRSGGQAPASAPPQTSVPGASSPHTPPPVAAAVTAPAAATVEAPPPLPPIESLEPGADIAQFMRAGVSEVLKRQAFRKLLEDPRFNVMDGLDVYIDDYSQPDPLPEGWLEKMNQTLRLGDYKEPEAEPPQEADEPPAAATFPADEHSVSATSGEEAAAPVEAPDSATAVPPKPAAE
jgi:hypothetical protein